MIAKVAPAVTRASLTLHQLPLQKPLAINSGRSGEMAANAALYLPEPQPLRQRDFSLLELHFSDGGRAFGELAPLPGFSKESMEQAARQTYQVASQLISPAVDRRVNLSIRSGQLLRACFPSVQFAFEMALAATVRSIRPLTVSDTSDALPARTALLVKPAAESKNSALTAKNLFLDANDESAIKIRESLNIANSTTVKMKVARPHTASALGGHRSRSHLSRDKLGIREEVSCLRQLVAENPRVKLRLDANQGWSYEQAKEFLTQCHGLPIEFIEEPCRNLGDNMRLLSHGFPVALDETLQGGRCQPTQFADLTGHWAALILKPTLLGGCSGCQPWLNYSQNSDTRLIVSSSFESPVGLAHLVSLARRWAPDEVHGLDTANAFTGESLLPFLTATDTLPGFCQWTI